MENLTMFEELSVKLLGAVFKDENGSYKGYTLRLKEYVDDAILNGGAESNEEIAQTATENFKKEFPYVSFEVYRQALTPTSEGRYVGKTPIYAQALAACEKRAKYGCGCYIYGVKPDGTKVLFL